MDDTGLTILTDALPRLFEKSHQRHTRGTANARGIGPGVAIVRQFVELHGGTIGVTSAMQCGSTFSADLPTHMEASDRS